MERHYYSNITTTATLFMQSLQQCRRYYNINTTAPRPSQERHLYSIITTRVTSPVASLHPPISLTNEKKEKLFRNLLAFFGLLKLSEHQLIKYRSSKLENTGELIPGESIIIQNKTIHLQCLCSKRWTMGYARLLNENCCLNRLKETLRYNLEQKYIGKIEIRFIKSLKDM